MDKTQALVIALVAMSAVGFAGAASSEDGFTNALNKTKQQIQPAADAFKADAKLCGDRVNRRLASKRFALKFQPEGQSEPKSFEYAFSRCQRKGRHAVALIYVSKESSDRLEIWRGGSQPNVNIFYGQGWVDHAVIAPEDLLKGPVTFEFLRGEGEDPDGEIDHYVSAQATLTPK